MPVVTFNPSGIAMQFAPGTELLDAIRQAGLAVEAPCGGKGICGKCVVRIADGAVDSDSLGVLPRSAIIDGYVLACKTRVLHDPITVEIPERTGRDEGKFSDAADDATLVRHELLPTKWQYDPLSVKWYLEVAAAAPEDGLSDLDRLAQAIRLDWGDRQIIWQLPVIRQIASVLRAQNGCVTVQMIRQADCHYVIGIEPGDTTTRSYGIAIDVGTTTIAVQLVYLPLAKVIATRNDYNDQVDCGLDVISRINYAKRPERLAELRKRVLGTINRLIVDVAASDDVRPAEIGDAVVAGNTTMVHLLLGLEPEYIRLAPYTPTVMSVPYLTASAVGLSINPLAWVYMSPAVGSYVGGDITSGLLCTELATESESVSLFIDIGTNGEIVVGNNEFLMACACSAGPAFEGGGIRHGMRAARGAIESVHVDDVTGTASWSTIGNTKPAGICGSGMISLLAELFLTGWIDAAGKLNRDKPSEAIIVDGRVGHYVIVPARDSDSGQAITISELDIENIIRAKAAIYSACTLMLEQVGMDFSDLAHIYIAGGFGRFLDLDKAMILGLVPELPIETFEYIGNSSLMGATMALVAGEFRKKQEDLAHRMTYIDLSSDPAYMDHYTGALFLPHTDPKRFPSAAGALAARQNGRRA